MGRKRNIIWRYFHKQNDVHALCAFCNKRLSYKTTTGNLRHHLRNRHYSYYQKLYNSSDVTDADADDDSNSSSVRCSSEIWSLFEMLDEGARCSLCSAETGASIEDMRAHLEEDHPGHMIGILNNKGTGQDKEDDDATDDERMAEPVQEDIFTDVLYLEEEPRPKVAKRQRNRRTSDRKPVRVSGIKSEPTQEVEYTVIERESESRPEIDSFLNYITVLLKNVPPETIPKLQLDIISLILNAQMAKQTTVTVPAIPVSSATNTVASDLGNVSVSNYHITIDKKDSNGT